MAPMIHHLSVEPAWTPQTPGVSHLEKLRRKADRSAERFVDAWIRHGLPSIREPKEAGAAVRRLLPTGAKPGDSFPPDLVRAAREAWKAHEALRIACERAGIDTSEP